MADKGTNILGQAVRLVLDIANGRHVLGRAIPPVLLVLDAILCSLVIWKVPCKPHTLPIANNEY